ncbi:MAG: hypothetical protein EZS28_012637 [Streblomastix strix]|uniref:Uncharacterized protein n=1 Tax=Streblomastix strix TaxID=222440 RepID=A0A5J4WAB8_9EUKA|nr:MAG: hypothetical protein EZS28_012637 [Streblomastix strix]
MITNTEVPQIHQDINSNNAYASEFQRHKIFPTPAPQKREQLRYQPSLEVALFQCRYICVLAPQKRLVHFLQHSHNLLSHKGGSIPVTISRETCAIICILRYFLLFIKRLMTQIIQIASDNTTAIANIYRKNAVPALSAPVRRILEISEVNQVQLLPINLQSIQNQTVDSLSRLESAGDYQLNDKAWQFPRLNFQRFLKVDTFSTIHNHRLPSYIVPTFNKNASGTDAFLQLWQNQSHLIRTPITMLLRFVYKIMMQMSSEMVIFPDQVRYPWYSDLERLLSKKIYLGLCTNNLKHGRRMKRQKTKHPPRNIVAWQIKTQMKKDTSSIRTVQDTQLDLMLKN